MNTSVLTYSQKVRKLKTMEVDEWKPSGIGTRWPQNSIGELGIKKI